MKISANVVRLSAALFLGTVLGACGNEDVTTDPAYHFAAMAHTTWKTKVPLATGKLGDGTTWTSVCSETYASDFALGKADLFEFGDKASGILPTGTMIRIDRLETGGSEVGGIFVSGTVLSGKSTGMIILLDEKLFLPNEFFALRRSPGVKDWKVDPAILEKP